MRHHLLALALAVPVALASPATAAEPALTAPGFGTVTLYAPAGQPKGMVLFLSGDGGWNLGVVDMARILAAQGVTVAGLSVPAYLKAAEAAPTRCIDLAGDLVAVARQVAARTGRLPGRPIIAGYSSGATMAYAALAQGGAAAFRGGLSLGFGADQAGHKPWCRGAQLAASPITRPEHGWLFAPVARLGVPWLVLQGEQDEVVDPVATRAFTARIADARLVALPKVGHGFSVPKNWVPQFSAAFSDLLR